MHIPALQCFPPQLTLSQPVDWRLHFLCYDLLTCAPSLVVIAIS